MKTLKEMGLKEKKILMRVDFNVPLEGEGEAIEVADDEKIKAALPTINYLLSQDCRNITLISHLGRPKGKVVPELSLEPAAERLAELLDYEYEEKKCRTGCKKFFFKSSQKAPYPEISLIENLRFWREEETDDEEFSRLVASLADIFVQEAFACCHRPHASIIGLPKYLPSCAGFLLEKEIKFLSKLLANPKKPFVVIIGGKKVETKAKLIDKISETANFILIGGLIKKELKEKNIVLKYPQKIVEPIDDVDGKDIGPRTITLFKEKITQAQTVFWNGPLGNFEIEAYNKGTKEIAKVVARVALSVIGGGETNQAAQKAGVADQITHRSTGGGASLEFLGGKTLPGIAALK